MKRILNLPSNLRAFFGFLRGITIVLGFSWLMNLIFSFSPFNFFSHLTMTAGDVAFQVDRNSIVLKSDTAKSDTLALTSLHGTLVANVGGGGDGDLLSVLHRTVIPGMAVIIIFSYALTTSLRNLCDNIDAGEMFTEENLRLIRGIGINLIVYSLAKVMIGLWSSAVMGIYLRQHVMLKAGLNFANPSGTGEFVLPDHVMSVPGGLLTGCLVLVLTQAFKQGLALKNENDLTV